MRDGDTVARLGGDEFAILIEHGPERPELIAQRVVEGFDEPFVIDGHVLVVRPSIGLSVAPADAPDVSADTLLRQSDAAMYAAKRTQNCEIHTFAPDMHPTHLDELELQRQRHAATGSAGDGIRLLGELRRAIDRRELTLAYQRRSISAQARSSGWRRWCGGRTPNTGCWSQSRSCQWFVAMD